MTHANPINRRKALATVAAAPAAVALGSTAAQAEVRPSELAALVRRYFEEVDAFNRSGDERTDEESDALAEVTFERTTSEMKGVPARSREDALAALDWLVKEDCDLGELSWEDGLSPHGEVVQSLVDAIRGYIEGRVA